MEFKKIIRAALKKESGANTKVAVAIITGVAVGATLAVLFAPQSGRKVLKTVGHTGRKFSDHVNDLVAELKEKFFNTGDDAEVQGSEEIANELHAAKKPKSDIKELLHKAHQAAAHSTEA